MSVGLEATGDYQCGYFSTSRLHGQRGNIGALQFLFAEFLDVFSELIVYVLNGFGRPGSIAHHDHWAIAAVFQLVERSPVMVAAIPGFITALPPSGKCIVHSPSMT